MTIKRNSNIRILSVNVRDFNTTHEEKLNHLIQECNEREIDMVLLLETNTKWISIMISSINYKLK